MNDYNNLPTRRLYNDDYLNNSDEDDDYSRYTNENHKLIPMAITLTNGFSRHSKMSKRSKRYTSWAIFGATFLFIFLFLYAPLFNNVPSRIVSISGWDRNTTRDTTYYVLPQVNTTLIDPVNICTEKLFLLVVICSSSVNFEIRQSIRETWANLTEFNYSFFAKVHSQMKGHYLDINFKKWKNYTIRNPDVSIDNDDNLSYESSLYNFAVKIVFLVGQTPSNETQSRINSESELHGDLIQESFLDSYNNLTLKTIMMLKWVNTSCSKRVKFLMKCDDDTFVNIPNLLHVLLDGTIPVYNATVQEYDQQTVKATSSSNRLNQHKNLLLGSRFCNSKPIANVTSKWYTPMYMYGGNIYPNYLSGTGYIMSMDVAVKLYNASLITPLFHLEDVYLTGICAESIKIKPRNHQLFSYTSYKKPCELKGMITKHELSASDMRKAYEFVTNTSVYCPKPDKYFHKWTLEYFRKKWLFIS